MCGVVTPFKWSTDPVGLDLRIPIGLQADYVQRILRDTVLAPEGGKYL